jgi:PAS domain S-box-containing protein
VRVSPQPLCVVAAIEGELVLYAGDAFRAVADLGADGRPLSGELGAALRPALVEALSSGHPSVVDLPEASFALSPIPAEGGEPVGVLISAQAAPSGFTDLLLRVSHEFHTPLTVLLGHADTLFEDAAPLLPDQRARLTALRTNAFRLLKPVETMVELSRAVGGPRLLRFEAVDLAALAQECTAAFRPVIEAASLRLRVEAGPQPLPAYVDRTMWSSAALHLISNAFKHSFQGEIAVRLSSEDGQAVLTVEDASDALAAPGRPPRARTREGAGLGLLLADQVARLHGGGSSRELLAGGSVARLSVRLGASHLPRDRVFPPRPQPIAALARPFVEEALLWLPGAPELSQPLPESATGRILVVCSDGDLRRYLAGLLSASWEVEVADAASSALQHVARRAPDLVVLDTPPSAGNELVRSLRQDPRTRRLPIVLLTAGEGDPAAALEAGADETLEKPFTARELIARIGAQLTASRARAIAEAHRTQLYALFQQAPAAICVLRGVDLVVEMANPRFEQIYRGSRKLQGRPLREAMPELQGQGFYELLDRVLRSGEPFVGHEQAARIDRRGDGALEEAFFTFVYQPMRDLSGRTEGLVLFGFDVTEQVRSRQQIERLVAQAREHDRRKDEFLAMLAHELRNPLAPLRTSVELIGRARAAGEPIERHLEVVDRQAENLARLVDDLLDVSRITRGKIELRREPLEVAWVLARAVDATRQLVDKRGHALRVHVPKEPLHVQADPVRLEQVLVNLLTNAAKYTDPGGSISVVAERRAGNAELRVRDSGQGISKEMLGKVFDLFTQAERGLDRAQGGLGIGLTIVRTLVGMHGGTVEARSDGPGKGSEFIVRLPALARGYAPQAPAGAAGQGQQASQRLRVSRRVLVVDDNVDAAESLAELLSTLGHEVRTAHDGLAALDAAGAFVPELVLLDIGLPGMDGYEVARRLRKLPRPPGPVVALSGYGQESDRRRSADAGFDAHLVKPVELEMLEELIRGLPSP